MRLPDLDKERSETLLSLPAFLASYNKTIPTQFPQASPALLREFKQIHKSLFKNADLWSLDQHRKKVMDWLPQRIAIPAS